MSSKLPEQPHLEYLKKRAKELLRAARSGDPKSVDRLRAAARRLARIAEGAPLPAIRLADAQLAIARELGFPSWPKLVAAVEAARPFAERIERLLAAIRDDDRDLARRIAVEHPELAQADLRAASTLGDAATVDRMLAADPEAVTRRAGPQSWTPLLYACASPLDSADPAIADALFRVVETLLRHGADPNDQALWKAEDPASGIPALFRACVANHVAVVRLLLERGADPNDGESIYHAAELDHREVLALLVEHGAEISRKHPRWNNTPLYYLSGWKDFSPMARTATAGMRWLLEHGADPNVPSYETAETPLHRLAAYGRGPEVAAIFLGHGAEVDRPRADGRTAYALAVRSGNVAMAGFLVERGADPARATIVDRFLGACVRGDGGAAREILARSPELVRSLDAEGRRAPALAAEEGRDDALRLMSQLGFDLGWEGAWGGTPLHHAAWHGRPATVRTLLAIGAPVNVRDSEYGSSPLAWAAHGSTHCRSADGDYVTVVDRLLDAGADRESSINRWGEPPESMSSPAVAELLRQRGFAPGAA